MSTAKIQSDLEELEEQIHDFDYPGGNANLTHILRGLVHAMTDLNEELAQLRKDLDAEPKKA